MKMRALLGATFDQKSKRVAQGRTSGAKSAENYHFKIHAKMDAEKGTKSKPKGSQNDAKMDAQIDESSCFLNKKKKLNLRNILFPYENKEFYDWTGTKIEKISTKNRSKNKAKKKNAKRSQQYLKRT